MLMFKKRIQLIIGLPQPKESEIQKELQIRLTKRTNVRWLCIDSEEIFSSQTAREIYQLHSPQDNGIHFLEDLSMANQVNFDNLLRSVSDQGVPVVGFDRFQPWKDRSSLLFQKKISEGNSYLRKMRDENFSGYNFSLVYVLLKGGHVDEELGDSIRQVAEKSAASLIEYDQKQPDDQLLDQLVELILV